MDDKQQIIFVVKNNYDEIHGVFNTESEANQLAGYLNSKYIEGKDISTVLHRIKYSVHKYSVKEFRRRKRLFWLVIIYFDKFDALNGNQYRVCNIEKNMIIDHEIDDQIYFREDGTHHLYLTVPLHIKDKELSKIAFEKISNIKTK